MLPKIILPSVIDNDLKFPQKISSCNPGAASCMSTLQRQLLIVFTLKSMISLAKQVVKPYVKRGKSDAIDAEAICEAVTRPTMRFVAIKTIEQQSLLSLHCAQSLLVRQRTQLVNG